MSHSVLNNIAMAFSPRSVVNCLLKKGLQRAEEGGGGNGHPRNPLATPLLDSEID